MSQALLEFLSSFPELSKEEAEAIAQHIVVKELPKGAVLISEGEVPQECYYILKGLVRQYHTGEDGSEHTTEFYSEQNGTISTTNYVRQTPSDQTLVCVEDCLMACGNRDLDEANFEKFPVLKEIVNRMMEEELVETKEKIPKIMAATPKERYEELLNSQPDLLNRAPLHQIASYLGMTAESLSRIRKRLASEKPVRN